MNKHQWQKHWAKQGPHDTKSCADCNARRKTRQASQRKAERESILRDCGLVKVRGALGGIYWE